MDPTVELAKQIMDAVKSGNGALVVALALVLVMTLARQLPIPFLKTKLGGWMSLFLLAAAGAVSTALAAGQALSGSLILTALGVGFAAAGGYEAIKDLLPSLLRLIGMIRNPVAEAEKAGNEAAAANPPQGVASVIPIKDVTVRGSFGNVTPEQKRAIAEKLMAQGYRELPDGTFERIKPDGEQ